MARNLNNAKVSAILAKSVENFVERANDMVKDDLCDRCPMQSEDCYPCSMYQQYFDIALSSFITMVAQWN
jgi:hypothetical protein